MEVPQWDWVEEGDNVDVFSLNPYSNGSTTMGIMKKLIGKRLDGVLILILMEVPQWGNEHRTQILAVADVLILILMEVPQWVVASSWQMVLLCMCLNPYSNGSTTMGGYNN